MRAGRTEHHHDTSERSFDLHLDDAHVATKGGRSHGYREEDGQRVMKQPEINVRVGLNRSGAHTTVWSCDFSHE